MKIQFIIGYPAKFCATEWQEIVKLSENGVGPDEDTYIIFKALEFNSDLEKELILARKNLHIPELGIDFEEYKKRKDVKADHTKKELEEILFYIHNYQKEILKIRKKLILHPQVQEQLDNLILGYFVEPFYRGIGYGTNADEEGDDGEIIQDGPVETVSIHISKRVSKNEFFKFIDDTWKEVNKLLNMLPSEEHFFISKRDLRIVELRDIKKLKYGAIAEKIIKEFSIDDVRGSINEDSIKTSYKRARIKINELATLKKGNTSIG